ncbi:MAG: hypothetical protein M1819_002469 [Sarea resinae]|nr:MAG: hypothetical protein M1819_002469 [Sarea resinae]
MATYDLLDQAEEDALHKSRLLNVEEKPFKRITKRLLTTNSLLTTPTLPPSPPPDASSDDPSPQKQAASERAQARTDILLDFAAFEASIARIQFLLTSNAQERARYAAEKTKILSTASAVRANTADLHQQLHEAQATLAVRKTYDELALKITTNRLLRPREDQEANLRKLEAEIHDLERESREYATTWAERREQFGRIVEEGMQLRRLIRDEKEEVERREGMEEKEDGEDGDASRIGTPRGEAGGATPLHASSDGSTPGGLSAPEKENMPSGRSPGRGGSHDAASPAKDEDAKDQDMAEQGEISEGEAEDEEGDVALMGGAPREGLVAGGEAGDEKVGDQMDTT